MSILINKMLYFAAKKQIYQTTSGHFFQLLGFSFPESSTSLPCLLRYPAAELLSFAAQFSFLDDEKAT